MRRSRSHGLPGGGGEDGDIDGYRPRESLHDETPEVFDTGDQVSASGGQASASGDQISASGDQVSGAGGRISDIGEQISEEPAREGRHNGDSAGYREREWISRMDFMRDVPLFQDSGFESLEEYLEDIDDRWREANGLPPLPSLEHGRPPTLDAKGARQVGLRLPGRDYELLLELSDQHGVAPATMARVIVVRAVRRASDLAEIDD